MTRYNNENSVRHLSRPAGRRASRRRRRKGSAIAVSMLILCTVIMVSAISSTLELCMPDAFADAEPMSPLSSSQPVSTPSRASGSGAVPDSGAGTSAESGSAGQDSQAQPSVYDYSRPVPQSPAVDSSYFDDAVFIGDSRTEGMITATGLYNAKAFTHKGLTVDTAFKDLVVCIDEQYYTVVDALSHTDFNKVYIMLGINETGWVYSSKFIEGYGKIIDAVREANPDAVIYIQEILPVSNSVSSTHDYIKNSKIDEYNELLQQLAEEKQVYFIDTAKAVAASDGSLPEDAAVDGIHMKNSYCQKWLDYLMTHTVSG